MNTKSMIAITGALFLSMNAASTQAGEGGIAEQKAESDQWQLTGEEMAAYLIEKEPTAAGRMEKTEEHTASERHTMEPMTAVEYKRHLFGSDH